MAKPNGKIYITGASGRLGRSVLEHLNAIPLVRKKSGLKNEIVTDFSADSLKKILNDASVIVHVAGSVDTLDKKKLWEVNVELTKRIVEATPKNCKIIFASSIAVYGKKLAEIPANEKTMTTPDSEYAKTKLTAEKLVSSLQNYVILRIGTLYGPQFEDYNKILARLEKGKMRLIGDGSNRIPFVHVDDVAVLFERAIERGSGVYVVAGVPLTQKKVYEVAAKELGVAHSTKRIGRRSALLLASLGELGYHFGKRPSLTKEHVGVLAYDRSFDCSKAKKELGFVPRSLEKGIKEMVLNYKRTFRSHTI